MRISGYCHNSSTGIKLIILLLLILWGALIVAIPMFFVKGSNALLIAMYLQNIGMFILPAWIAATLFWGNAGKSLYLNKAPRIIELLGIIALFIVATPALNRIVEWNEAMHLPEALYNIEQWMRQQENAATKITEQILQVNSFSHFLAVIFGIGILTGIGEEMIFRGVLQRISTRQKSPSTCSRVDLCIPVQCHTFTILWFYTSIIIRRILRISIGMEQKSMATDIRPPVQ